jgi:bifunctional DNA-binding transcriptional regulator/antitoxin component of YhaV-PrlF toxin-antitoxin module
MDSAYVTTNGRIVIPVRLRRKLSIKSETKVCFIERGSDILFQPVTKQYVRSVRGMLKDTTAATAELLREHKQDREQKQAKRKRLSTPGRKSLLQAAARGHGIKESTLSGTGQ